MRRVFIALMLVLLASDVSAGAWMREKGSVFLSFGATIKDGSELPEQTYYGEYGIGQKMTVGGAVNTTQGVSTEGSVFLRFPVRNGDSAKISAEVGLGLTSDASGENPFLRTGLSWGKGLKLRGKGGWLNVDGSVLWALGDQDHQLKIDTTLGVALNDRFKLLGQTFLFSDTSETSLTLSPSVVMRIGKRKSHLQVALDQKFGGDDKTALRVGLWQEF